MSDHNAPINRHTMAFQLNEAMEEIHATLRTEDADQAIWVSLAEILGHLCLAWHRRGLGPDDVMRESLEQHELRSSSVPNWGGRFRLVDFDASHPAIDPQLFRRKINRDTVATYLHTAEATLRSLTGKIESGEMDACGTAPLATEFAAVLHNLCLAWHFRYLSSTEISALDPNAINEAGSWLPPWQWDLRLIPLGEEATRLSERS